MSPRDHWQDQYDRRWQTTVEVGTVHPLGRFLAAVAEAGFPATVPVRYARVDSAVVEWPDEAPIPYAIFLRARKLSGAKLDADCWCGDPDRESVLSAVCLDPWPHAALADFALCYPELSHE